jgi:multicomponent Na+:H+ antiporter subunit D
MMLLDGYTENAVLLVMAIVLPLLGALLLPFFARHAELRDAVSITVSLALCVLLAQLLDIIFEGERPRIQLWELFPGFSVALALRPLGALFAATAGFLWAATTFYSIGYMRKNKERHQINFYRYFALSMSATMGIAFSDNLFTLFIFYELLTLLTYPLVVHKGDKASVHGARKYIMILLFGSLALFLPAILLVYHITGTLNFTRGGIIEDSLLPWQTGLLLAMFVFGIAKGALMPMHRWLPSAMVAPAPVSALLHAVAVVKAGVFSIVMVILYIFGYDWLHLSSAEDWRTSDWLRYTAGFTIVIASLTALRHDHLKQRLAYSTIAQLGYITLGAALLAPLSIAGAILHIVAHAFGKISLFFAAGAIYTSTGKNYVSELDGIGRVMPWTMAAFTLGALSVIGIPPTIGFLSKWYILLGAATVGDYLALSVMAVSSLLSAAYLLPIIHRAFFKPPLELQTYGEAPRSMVVAMLVTSGMCLGLTCFAGDILHLAGETVNAWEPLHLP